MRSLFTWDYAACGPSADGHVDDDGGRPGDGDDQTLAAAHWEVAVGGSLLKQFLLFYCWSETGYCQVFCQQRFLIKRLATFDIFLRMRTISKAMVMKGTSMRTRWLTWRIWQSLLENAKCWTDCWWTENIWTIRMWRSPEPAGDVSWESRLSETHLALISEEARRGRHGRTRPTSPQPPGPPGGGGGRSRGGGGSRRRRGLWWSWLVRHVWVSLQDWHRQRTACTARHTAEYQ